MKSHTNVHNVIRRLPNQVVCSHTFIEFTSVTIFDAIVFKVIFSFKEKKNYVGYMTLHN